MQIVELGDCSMVIMKDSSDTPWFSVGNIFRQAQRWKDYPLKVRSINNGKNALATSNWCTSSEAIYTGGRLVLFFKGVDIQHVFKVHDSVKLDF